VDDFLDEDEREANARAAVDVAPEFDTFGATAAGRAREAAEAEAGERHREAIPGLLPAELLAPVSDSMGPPLHGLAFWWPLNIVATSGRANTTVGWFHRQLET
jgi:hypothetical protein